MRIWAVLALGATLLSACTPMDQEAVARQTAKSILIPIVEKRFPGLPSDVIVGCAVDNATLSELVALGASASTGNSAETGRISNELLTKPQTLTCIAEGVVKRQTGLSL